MTTITVASTFIPIDDPQAALGFYRDILGYEVQQDVELEGMHWITLTNPAQPDVSVVLESVGAGGAPADREVMGDLLA
ncbi:MAG TPA: VOC family protein, partial [Pseudolysinimonas sp.]|nr:VOC family protein [Pseudolysinimonas sp.]